MVSLTGPQPPSPYPMDFFMQATLHCLLSAWHSARQAPSLRSSQTQHLVGGEGFEGAWAFLQVSTMGSLEDGGSCEVATGPPATFFSCLNAPFLHLSNRAPHPCPHSVTCHGLPAGSLPPCPYSKLPETRLRTGCSRVSRIWQQCISKSLNLYPHHSRLLTTSWAHLWASSWRSCFFTFSYAFDYHLSLPETLHPQAQFLITTVYPVPHMGPGAQQALHK